MLFGSVTHIQLYQDRIHCLTFVSTAISIRVRYKAGYFMIT